MGPVLNADSGVGHPVSPKLRSPDMASFLMTAGRISLPTCPNTTLVWAESGKAKLATIRENKYSDAVERQLTKAEFQVLHPRDEEDTCDQDKTKIEENQRVSKMEMTVKEDKCRVKQKKNDS